MLRSGISLGALGDNLKGSRRVSRARVFKRCEALKALRSLWRTSLRFSCQTQLRPCPKETFYIILLRFGAFVGRP